MENHEFVMKVMAYGKTVTIAQVEDALDIHEFLDMCKALATSIGFLEENWKDAVVQMAESYTESAEDKSEALLNDILSGKYKMDHLNDPIN